MRSVQQKLRWPGVIASITLLALMFSSCVKHNDTPQAPTASMAVIDVSPTAPPLDFYLNGSKVNSSAISYAGGLSYFTCYAGNARAAFYQSGNSSILAADSVALAANTAYTVVLSNLPTSPDVTLFRDSIYTPAGGTATLRVINASPDAGSIDFGYKGQTLLGTGVAYRKATSFKPVTPGSSADTLLIYQAGTTNIIQKIATPLQTGGVFTVYLYGFAAQTAANEKLNAGLMENTFFY